MKKETVLKVSGILVTGLLLLGAAGCNKQEATPAATDTSTAPETAVETTAPTQAAETGTQILVTDTGFEPKSVTIKVGESVTWTNNTSGTVRIASDPHPLHTGLAGFDDLSGAALGDTYTFTFTKAGTFGYHNHNSTSVKGTVTVTE